MNAAVKVLDSLAARTRYDEIKQENPIKHTFTYRSAAGRLQGHKDDALKQTVELKIKSPSSDTTGSDRSVIVEAGLAALIERYETFGPFYQYPRTFIVGPSQFKGTSNEMNPPANRDQNLKNMPALRDVDALIWMRPLTESGSAYLLGHVRFFHDDFAPGVAKAQWVVYQSGPGATVKEDDAKTTLKSILHNFFADGDQYSVIKAPGRGNWNQTHQMQSGGRNKEAHLTLLWKANEIARERDLIPSNEAPGEKEETRALAVALVGNDPRVVPSKPDQRDHPVPIGLVNNERLIEVLTVVVLKSPSMSKESRFNQKISSSEYVLSDDELA